ncbi:hypothetical protein DT23_01595 [Thioclava indica]|uniref:Uncharacterized protein n=1 Tax=Thioclava indica TaxID=1353528 RepID=A0A074JVJ2_9RHOB|nr:hypothetical protein DT23_01595 [Thioclava indica]
MKFLQKPGHLLLCLTYIFGQFWFCAAQQDA